MTMQCRSFRNENQARHFSLMGTAALVLVLLGTAFSQPITELVNTPTSDYSQCDAGKHGSYKIVVKSVKEDRRRTW